MRIFLFRITLLCSLLLQSKGLGAQVSGTAGNHPSAENPAVLQTAQKEGNKKIAIIYKGSKKEPAASLSMDGNEKGELPNGMYLEMSIGEGSHIISVGKFTTHSIMCVRTSNGICAQTGPKDFVEKPFRLAIIKILISASETTYILVEPNKPETTCCTTIDSSKLTDYKLHELKAKDGIKLIKKFQPFQ